MSSVDNRIVQMQFDNAKFENGVSTSINSIDKLKQALQFNDAGKGFDNITKAASSVDLSAVQNSIGAIEQKFSIVSEAIRRNVGKVIDELIGKATQLANALFVAPRTDGFKEYELKMGSVQTIMASTGATLEEVNRYLDELNTYSDKTIYSFSDMTSNIGKFTNAGVKLEDAVKAIQGISNEAAVSGANSAEASRAMYNFAQALSAGAVKLIDWKSIENANMATVEFKQELLDTAVALGTVVKDGDKYRSVTTDLSGKISEAFTATSMFNESLSHQWLTTDVLTTTLGRYADASTELGKKAFAAAQDVKTWSQLLDTLKEAMGSGWSQSFEILIGDFNEAKELFTMISNTLGGIIDKTAKVRNGFLKMWDDKGGREKLIKQLETILGQIDILSDKVLKNILGSKYNKILGETNDILDDTTKKVDNLTEAEKKFVEEVWLQGLHGTGEQRAKEAEELGLNYERIQNALNNIADGSTTLDEAMANTVESVSEIKKTFEAVEDSKWSRSFDNMAVVFQHLGTSLKNVAIGFGNIVKIFVEEWLRSFDIEGLTYDLRGMTRIIVQITARFRKWTEESQGLRSVAYIIVQIFNKAWIVLKTIINIGIKGINTLTKGIFGISNSISNVLSGIDKNSRLYRAITAIRTIITKVKDAFIDAFSKIDDAAAANPKLKEFKDNFDKMKDSLKGFFDSGFTKLVEWLEKVAAGDISFDGLVEFVRTFGTGESKVEKFFSKIKEGFTGLDKFEEIWTKIKEALAEDSIKDMANRAFNLTKSIASGIINGLKVIDWEKVINMLKFGAFLVIAWQTYKVLSSIRNITKGFNKATIGILEAIAGAIGSFQTVIRAEALKRIAESIAILGATMLVLAMLPVDQLKAASIALGTVIVALAILVKAIGGNLLPIVNRVSGITDAIKIDTTMLGIAAMLFAMYSIFKFAVETEGDIMQGIGVVGLMLLELITFITLLAALQIAVGPRMTTLTNTLKKIANVMIVLTGVLAGIVYLVDNYSESIPEAVVVMGLLYSLLVLVSLISMIPSTANLPAVATGMLLLAVAITALTPSLIALSLIPFDKLKTGVLALVGMAAALALISRISKNGGAFLKTAAGVVLIAATMAYIGKNAETAAKGATMLASALAVLTILSAIGSLLAPEILLFGQSLMWVSGALLVGALAFWLFADGVEKVASALPTLAEGVVILASKITNNAPLIASSIEVVLLAMTDALAKSTPNILKSIEKFLVEVSNFLLSPDHGIIGMILDILDEIGTLLAKIVGRLAEILINFIIDLLVEVGDAISQKTGELANAVEYLVASLTNMLVTILAAVVDGVVNGLLGKFGIHLNLSDQVTQTITNETGNMVKGAGKTFGTGNDFKQFRNAGASAGAKYGDSYTKGFGNAMERTVNKSFDQLSESDIFSHALPEGSMGPMPVPFDIQTQLTGITIDNEQITKTIEEIGENGGVAFNGGFIDGAVISKGDFDEYINNYNEYDFGEIAFGNGQEYTGGMFDGMYDWDIEGNITNWADEFKQPDEFKELGSDNAKSFTDGLEENRGPIKRKATQLSNVAIEQFESKKPEYYASGVNAMQGFIDGLNHKSEVVIETVTMMANKVKEAFSGKKGLDEHSPSKVFMTYGEYASEGFIVGLTSYSDRISDSSSAVANSAIDALKTPLSHITDILNGNLVVDPTIRPVLDLTELQNGTGMINDMFANRSVQLAGATAKLNDFNSTMIFDAKRNQNRDVVDEMRSLRSDVNALADKMDTLQVVMDSGQLVGAISSPMDAALGQRAIRKGRRN